jgi:hypothetical protein
MGNLRSGKLTKSSDGEQKHNTDNDVTEEQGSWTTSEECVTRTDE